MVGDSEDCVKDLTSGLTGYNTTLSRTPHALALSLYVLDSVTL